MVHEDLVGDRPEEVVADPVADLLRVAAGVELVDAIAWLEGQGEHSLLYTPLKFFATWLSAWSGVPAGVFAPSLAIGAGLGHDVAMLSGLITESSGNRFMFSILAAGASYIAVPAAMKIAVPKANPGIYLTMALAVTFPINITIGMPLYYWICHS